LLCSKNEEVTSDGDCAVACENYGRPSYNGRMVAADDDDDDDYDYVPLSLNFSYKVEL
jgi:hypothetical protein